MTKNKWLALFDKAAPVVGGVALALLYLETRKPLRPRTQPGWDRRKTNAAVAATASVGLRLVLVPALVLSAQRASQKQSGLLPMLPLPAAAQGALAFLLLDYGNYLWHVLNHRFTLLWRFHHVHHTDLDLDVTTAWRFHLGEVLVSAFYRGAVARVVGPTPQQVLAYELLYEAATAFHHSNWRLPYRLEKALNWLVVTPRMHGIHHSIVHQETDSNFSVVFSFWDRLHQTVRLNVPQQEITVGVPAFRDPQELTYGQLQQLPFTSLRPWRLPDGSVPEREPLPLPLDDLAE
ncbi:sterol desaturase family protein [Rufibacter ruber]|uniref:sterol desaturase family protein n=1 Tax=Rufibacter ruber TaxID=1783499 RepID=UPI00082F8B76|nr:sterol desaturase family protein [Rufibacter ruber]